jgi:hypothetical protein
MDKSYEKWLICILSQLKERGEDISVVLKVIIKDMSDKLLNLVWECDESEVNDEDISSAKNICLNLIDSIDVFTSQDEVWCVEKSILETAKNYYLDLKFKNNNIDANIFLKQSFKNTLSIKDALNLSDKDFLKEYQNVIDNKISSKYIPAEVEDIADVELYIASTNELRSIQEEIDSLLNKINKIKEQVSKKERSAVEVRNEIFLMEVKAKKTLLGIESEKVAVAKKSLELK